MGRLLIEILTTAPCYNVIKREPDAHTTLMSASRIFSAAKVNKSHWVTICKGVKEMRGVHRNSQQAPPTRKRYKFKKHKIRTSEIKRKAAFHNTYVVCDSCGRSPYIFPGATGTFYRKSKLGPPKISLLRIPVHDLCKTGTGARHLAIGRPNQKVNMIKLKNKNIEIFKISVE